MSYSEPGQFNTFIPTHEATANMVVGFGRNVKAFSVNRWMEIRPVTKTKGWYLRWKSEQAARVRYADARDFAWADGNDRPTGQDNLELFEFQPYETERLAPSFTIGNLTLDQADWPLHEYQTQQIAQQLMTIRTTQGVDFLQNATWGDNCANVDGAAGALNGNAALLASGQNWGNGTSTAPNIKKSIQAALNIITKKTLGAVNIEDLALVISPDVALTMSQSPEVNDIMARSIYAMPNLTGDLWTNEAWALPDKLYNLRLIIDKTVRITGSKKRADAALTDYTYVWPSAEAYIVCRPGAAGADGKETALVKPNTRADADLDGNEKDKSNYFPVQSTIVGFFQEEMTIEAMKDAWNRRTQGSVVSNYDIRMTSNKSAFQFKAVFGS